MNNRLLNAFSILLAFCTFILVFSGGMVTSKEAGMTVPDWPTSYGYNMFAFPISRWVGGIFFEHIHRVIASVVGFLTLILCGWIWKTETRRWLKWLSVIAVVGVILQGVLGGLRVILHMDYLGIFHGCLAQSFLLLCSAIALFTSGWWKRVSLRQDGAQHFTSTLLFLTVLIFFQMAVAATMRHAHAGLSIPDFPTAYGKILPPMHPSEIARINEARAAASQPATSAMLIGLQYLHRLIAYFLGLAIPWFAWRACRTGGILKPLSLLWSGLVLVQITLGAWTIWSNKAADIATSHVAVGAMLFVLGGLMTIIAYRSRYDARENLPGRVANLPIIADARA